MSATLQPGQPGQSGQPGRSRTSGQTSPQELARSVNFTAFLLILGLIAALLSGCCGQKAVTLKDVRQRGKLVAGVKFDSKPFGYLDASGKLNGYDIALMKELGRRLMGQPDAVEFQQVLSSTRVIALNTGSVDVVAATMTITPERAKVIDFSTPYYVAHQAVLVPKNSTIKTLNDLNGHTVLFVMGSTSELNIKKRLPKARYLGFKSVTDALSALKGKRGEAMTSDDSILYGFLADNCGYRMLDERLSDEPYGLAFRKGQGPAGDTLKDRVNEALKAMQQDGTLARLKAKWIENESGKKTCQP